MQASWLCRHRVCFQLGVFLPRVINMGSSEDDFEFTSVDTPLDIAQMIDVSAVPNTLETAQLVLVQPPPAPLVTRRGNRRGAAKHGVGTEECPVKTCEDNKAQGSRYCWLHTATMKWLQKHYTNPKIRATPEAEEYRIIFGDKNTPPDDQELADNVVEELTDADVASNRKAGETRQKPNLSTYVRARGTRESQEDKAYKYKWEEEIFVTKMQGFVVGPRNSPGVITGTF